MPTGLSFFDTMNAIAYIWFDDGKRRPVYEAPDGRQFVFDDQDEPVYGIWFIPQ